MSLANAVSLMDSAKGAEILKRSYAAQETLPPGMDSLLAAATCEMVAGFIATYENEWQTALDHAQEVIRLHTELGFETEVSALASSTAAVSALLLGDPETTIRIVESSQPPSASVDGDEIRA
ncbi:MAG: hypothetical protein ACI8TP_001397 [Acidimicrobiales bacterium]|jgi:hypothetical protein